MKAPLLVLWLFFCRTSAHSRASVLVSPNKAQYFEYDSFTVSCQASDSGEWSVWRYTADGLGRCGSSWGIRTATSCSLDTVKRSASGVYWCQSEKSDTSDAVNITVTADRVILQSPVLPVMEGHDVTLHCQTKSPPSKLPADFYKDGSLIRTEPTGHMTIHRVTKSDEGAYKCSIQAGGESASSWMLIKGAAAPVSIAASPDTSQRFEYEDLTLSCGPGSSLHAWTIKRSQSSGGPVSGCGQQWGRATAAGCVLVAAKQSDSGVYWCESAAARRSSSINVSVVGERTAVILQSPVLPVMEGHDVTLHCQTKSPPSKLPADFYKDGSLIRTEPTGHMTIHRVTKSDEGAYKCSIQAGGESASSWMWVRANSSSPSALGGTLPAVTVVRHVLICCPYVICTVLMLSVYHHRPSGPDPSVTMTTLPRNQDDDESQQDDVTVATEHCF
ncbi:high affinity immunoglobulin gamma Fc receptor I-like isoform X2 [Betta splendens]|uniref:high affinity immunoglobulin gamma Fc receptor I-like isoform X2 n=1 Tax=Betta splendens TaxID=158456 RepID=UPI00244E3BF0|nr:high affinity immunoglobulin gamma Fc receptor I-like isoform X2 [Betta splendens]